MTSACTRDRTRVSVLGPRPDHSDNCAYGHDPERNGERLAQPRSFGGLPYARSGDDDALTVGRTRGFDTRPVAIAHNVGDSTLSGERYSPSRRPDLTYT